MPPDLQIITNALDQDKPAGQHKDIRHPIARIYRSPTVSSPVIVHLARVKIVRVRIWRGRVTRSIIGAGILRALHHEAELDQRDAQAGARSVFGGVGGVQKVGEQEADELEGHGDHAIPDEGDDGTDGHAFDVNVIGPAEAGGEDGGFPVGRGGVCGCLFVGLRFVC